VKLRSLWIRFAPLAALLTLSASAAPLYWDNSSADSLWSTLANWSTDPAGGVDPLAVPGAGDVATFNATSLTTDTATPQTVNLGGNISVSGLSYLGQSNVLTLQGGGSNVVLSIGADGIIASGAGNSSSTTTPPTTNPTKIFNIGNTTAGQNVSISLMASQTWASNISGTVISSDGIYVKNGVSLGIAGNHTLTLGGTSSSTPLNTISGNISDGGADRSLSITLAPGALNNNNRWTLSGNNSYTGLTTITNGALTIGHVNALGATSAGTSVASGAGLFFRGTVSGTMAAEALTIAGNGPDNKGALRNVNGTNTWHGTIAATTTTGTSTTIGSDAGSLTLSSTADITTSGSGTLRFVGAASLTVNGSISGAASVTNVAASGGTAVNGAVVIFGGDSKAYTGTTTVTGGILRVNTGITGTSAFNVGAGGILQGNGGTINTTISTIINGASGSLGTISAGMGTGNIGSLTTGELSLGAFSRMVADVNYDGLGTSDVINVSALTIASGAALEINLMGTTPQIGSTVLVIKNSGVWNGGLLSVGGSTVADDATFTTASGTYRLDYNYAGSLGSGVAVTLLEVIPEPSTMGLLGFAAIAVGMRRRRA